jgi:PAS domain-containing protein
MLFLMPPVTRKAITVGTTAFLIAMSLLTAAGAYIFLDPGMGSPEATGLIRAASFLAILVLYLRGWKPARYLIVLAVTLAGTLSCSADRLTLGLPNGLIVPVLVSALVSDRLGILASGAGVILSLYLRFGPSLAFAFCVLVVAGLWLLLEGEGRNAARRASALVRSEARFRALVEESPFSILVFTPDGKLVESNEACDSLWGLPPR